MAEILFFVGGMIMPRIKKNELMKFVKDNPNTLAAQSIMEQLREGSPTTQAVNPLPETELEPIQIRNTASYLETESPQNRNSASDLETEGPHNRDAASDRAADKINALHQEILGGYLDLCQKAIEIGRLLDEQQEVLRRGEWIKWIDTQLNIGPRQVQNYMRIYLHGDEVLISMARQIESGTKPSLRKMLLAVTEKDKQSMAEYSAYRQPEFHLQSKQKKLLHKEKIRNKEMSTLAQWYVDKKIDDNSLIALMIKWNNDHPDNPLYGEDVRKEIRHLDEKLYPDIFNPSRSGKINITVSIDRDLWNDYVDLGGKEAFLNEHIKEHLTNYMAEKRSLRIVN
jgi:hypothetical protein